MGVSSETSRLSPFMSSISFSSVDPILSNRSNNPRQILYDETPIYNPKGILLSG